MKKNCSFKQQTFDALLRQIYWHKILGVTKSVEQICSPAKRGGPIIKTLYYDPVLKLVALSCAFVPWVKPAISLNRT